MTQPFFCERAVQKSFAIATLMCQDEYLVCAFVSMCDYMCLRVCVCACVRWERVDNRPQYPKSGRIGKHNTKNVTVK